MFMFVEMVNPQAIMLEDFFWAAAEQQQKTTGGA